MSKSYHGGTLLKVNRFVANGYGQATLRKRKMRTAAPTGTVLRGGDQLRVVTQLRISPAPHKPSSMVKLAPQTLKVASLVGCVLIA